ncbi:hypothetical protein [Nocardia puris]|uniref:Secreted protein n=1 Tax=Nocardia puris TaxID=208602 RepID=A0A366DVD3_9NOCA|nr:hypothetical protein [Nocardia puris]RBO94061.1 hypothetical protein DFR74_102481 [Nocardia puris]
MTPRLPATLRDGAALARRFARTTPGIIAALALALVVLCLFAGFTGAGQLGGKIERGEEVLTRTEPLADAAQNLYVSLSAADAAAAEAFLSGGVESPEIRVRYQQALADAADALAQATTGAADERTRRIVARISAELPAYTGLVEAARANNRQGFPVGSAYLRQASDVMQNSLLRNAEELSSARFAALHEDQRAIGALPFTTIAAQLLVLAALGGGSLVLLRRTNRRVNTGLVAAAAATGVALVWTVAATGVAGAALGAGPGGSASDFETLAEARILAQQARTAETLQLITRGDIAASEEAFTTHTTALRDRVHAVTGEDSAAAQRLQGWTEGHRWQLAAYQSADYPAAVTQAIGTGPQTSATRFAELDRTLREDLQRVRSDLRGGVDGAGDTLTLSPSGTLLLMLFAAAAAVAGLWPRLKEFL